MRPRLAATLLAAAALGCAQPGTPPGGEPDRSPPRVIGVYPSQFDTLARLDERIEIRFDERISERLDGVPEIRDAVIVSPATSPVEAIRNSRSIEIGLVQDWEPELVYRVTVQPVFRDLFGNIRREPIEVVFSTGAPILDAALAGFVSDRITGEPVDGARVEATRRADGRTYVALTDSAGFFAMRYMPEGAFDVRAWTDQDRDRQVDFLEIHDSTDVAFAPGDTAVIELALLPGDSTPAQLVRADAIDSTRVRLLLDDYFAPGPVEGRAVLYGLPDSVRLGEGELLHGTWLDSLRAADAAARATDADTVGAAGVRADSVGVPGIRADSLEAARVGADTLAPAAPDAAAAPDRTPDDDEDAPPIPSRELIVLAPVHLRTDSTYRVVVEGLTNIRGVPGGGGAAEFEGPAPPADTATVDTTAAGPDAEPVAPDTVPIGPDTVPPPPDTSGDGVREGRGP
ncbi:MAG: Ig-like domain-containing protein [Gemmatimonadota bacterium]